MRKKKGKSKAQEELEGGINILPVFVGIVCSGILATPVVLLMGLKLGMFAAIGGGEAANSDRTPCRPRSHGLHHRQDVH